MTLGGLWRDALEEARRVGERFTQGALNERALSHAAYRQAEVHRLQGDFGAAAAAYREASRFGLEPQPGLACCGWGKETGRLLPLRSVVRSARRPRRSSVRRCCPPTSRSCSPSKRSTPRAPRPLSSRSSPNAKAAPREESAETHRPVS